MSPKNEGTVPPKPLPTAIKRKPTKKNGLLDDDDDDKEQVTWFFVISISNKQLNECNIERKGK